MIQAATKYTRVEGRGSGTARGDARPTSGRAVQTNGLPARRSPSVFIPTLSGAAKCLKDWYWRELKEGGFLCEYLANEKRRTPQQIRRVARMMDGFQQNNKSDFRRLAAVPARLYHRWKAEDQHFFEDDANLRSLKKDNPDLPVYVGARQMPVSRYKKVYGPQSTVHSPETAGGTPAALSGGDA